MEFVTISRKNPEGILTTWPTNYRQKLSGMATNSNETFGYFVYLNKDVNEEFCSSNPYKIGSLFFENGITESFEVDVKELDTGIKAVKKGSKIKEGNILSQNSIIYLSSDDTLAYLFTTSSQYTKYEITAVNLSWKKVISSKSFDGILH